MDEEGVIVIEDVVAAPELHKKEVVPLAVKVAEAPLQIIASLLETPDKSVSVILIEGKAFTVPLTEVVASEAPVDVAVIVPIIEPTDAKELNLTYNI